MNRNHALLRGPWLAVGAVLIVTVSPAGPLPALATSSDPAVTVMSATLPSPTMSSGSVWAAGKAYLFGGLTDSGPSDDILEYDPTSDTITIQSALLPSALYDVSAVWNGSYVFLFGGRGTGSTMSDDILRYDPSTDTISTMTASLPTARYNLGGAWDGYNVYLFGGRDSAALSTILRYNTSTDTISTMTAALSPAIWGPEVLPHEGGIYIFGEYRGLDSSRVLRYDISGDGVEETGMSLPNREYSATSLAWDGRRAYLMGGSNSAGRVDNIVEFDPSNKSVTILPHALPSPRSNTASASDGTNTYVFGGVTASGAKINEIVRFIPRPGPPLDALAFSGPFPGTVSLSWNPPTATPDVVYYEIFRGTSSASYSLHTALPGSSTVLVDPETEFAQTYYYKVRATTSGGTSEFSNEVSAASLGSPLFSGAPIPCDDPYLGIQQIVCVPAPAGGVPPSCYLTPWHSLECALKIQLGPADCENDWCPTANERIQELIPDDPVPLLFPPNNATRLPWETGFPVERDPVSLGLIKPLAPGTTLDCYSSSPSNQACTVVFVNGYWIAGADEASMESWSTIRSDFVNAGYSEAVRAALYGGDCGVDVRGSAEPGHPDIDNPHNTWFAGNPHTSGTGCIGVAGAQRHTLDTDLRHLAYHLAWFIWNQYTSRGKPVDVVAYSMGGLMVRYALGMIEMKDPNWPEYLLVEDVVTLSTPHGGSFWACGGTTTELRNMCTWKKTMKVIKPIQNPQGRNGTTWTLYGSEADSIIDEGEATDMKATMKLIYDDPNYGHVFDVYWTDNLHAHDARYRFQTTRADVSPQWWVTEHGAHGIDQIVLSATEGVFCCA